LTTEARRHEKRDRGIGISGFLSPGVGGHIPRVARSERRVNVDFPRSRELGKKTFDVGTRERRDSDSFPRQVIKGEACVRETVGCETPKGGGRVSTLRAVDL
jgi:hypothetical protein